MSLLVSDSNITHWIHPSNFQTEDGILSKEKKKNQPILSSKKCEDIYHLLLNFFFSLHIVEDEATIRRHILGTHFLISLEAGNQTIRHH